MNVTFYDKRKKERPGLMGYIFELVEFITKRLVCVSFKESVNSYQALVCLSVTYEIKSVLP